MKIHKPKVNSLMMTLTLGAVLAACSGSLKGHDYAAQDRQTQISELKGSLGINITFDTSVDSYNNEYSINRILRVLETNKEQIQDSLKQISEINISGTGSFSVSEKNNQLIVTIPFTASQNRIVEFLKNAVIEKNKVETFSSTTLRIGSGEIQDYIGLVGDEAKQVSEKILAAGTGIDFKKIPMPIDLTDQFGVSSFHLIIDYKASQSEIHDYFSKMIDIRDKAIEVSTELKVLLNTTVVIQEGVLTPDEYNQGIKNLRDSAPVITKLDKVLPKIVLGKRVLSDDEKKTASFVMLPFNFKTGDLEKAFSEVPQDFKQEIQAKLASLEISFSKTKKKITVVDESTENSVAHLNFLTMMVSTIEQRVTIDRADQVGLTKIRFSTGSDSSGVSLSSDEFVIYSTASVSGFINEFEAKFPVRQPELEQTKDELAKTKKNLDETNANLGKSAQELADLKAKFDEQIKKAEELNKKQEESNKKTDELNHEMSDLYVSNMRVKAQQLAAKINSGREYVKLDLQGALDRNSLTSKNDYESFDSTVNALMTFAGKDLNRIRISTVSLTLDSSSSQKAYVTADSNNIGTLYVQVGATSDDINVALTAWKLR